jgi:uncharacterized phage protein (TIGR01671 family)
MREVLFRGKTYKGEWVEGNFIDWGNHVQVYIFPLLNYATSYGLGMSIDIHAKAVIPETVGQLTGLTDKNGKKIFEGDIVRFREWSNGDMCWIGKVHYEHQQFIVSGGKNKECETPFTLVMSRFIPENIEIIGNIHDNPELLKYESEGEG